MQRLLVLAFVTAAAGLLGGCGDGSGSGATAGSACAPAVRERLDPGSGVHLLPGATEPDYLSEPPTSGPHLTGRPATGAVEEPLDRPSQVLLLEEGGVLIQYRDLDTEEVAALEGLAGDQVVVAPNPELEEPVVATAWLTKLTCERPDVEELRRFVDERLGQGPAGGEAA